MAESSPVSALPDRRDGLDRLPADADGPRVWEALGAQGRIRDIYPGGDPAAGVDPARLGRLMSDVDQRMGLGTTLAVCVQAAAAVPLLATGSGPAVDALAEALSGRRVTSLAATDESAGCDLTGLGTEVRIGADEVEVSGMKRWITNAVQADQHLVLARHRPGRHFTNFTWVLVPALAPGVRAEAADTDLFEGSGTGHLAFDRVRLPRDHLVGRPGRGLASFAAHIAVERLAGALWGVALCRRVLADTKRRLEARAGPDGPLWQVPAVRLRYAECLMLARQLHALTRELGDRVAHRRDSTAAALLKSSVARVLDRVLAECAHLQGAEGFTPAGAQRLRAQAALFGIGGGTTEVVLAAVADAADPILAELRS